jgi:hypothetical protein
MKADSRKQTLLPVPRSVPTATAGSRQQIVGDVDEREQTKVTGAGN